MRPTRSFVSLSFHEDDSDDVSTVRVLLPDSAEAEEHEHDGVHFVVHHPPIGNGGSMWVATERSTGTTTNNRKRTLTKDAAISNFISSVDGDGVDIFCDRVMNALLELEDTEIITFDEYEERVGAES